MNDFMVDVALNHFGFDEEQKARIKASIPKAQYVAALVKNNKTVINEMIDVMDMIFTQIKKVEQL